MASSTTEGNLGWKTVFGIYLWHLIYGLNLGAFYSPLQADLDGTVSPETA